MCLDSMLVRVQVSLISLIVICLDFRLVQDYRSLVLVNASLITTFGLCALTR